jgi:hypothetical protein
MKKYIYAIIVSLFSISQTYGQICLLDDYTLEDCSGVLGIYSDINVSKWPYQIYFDMETYNSDERVLIELCISDSEFKKFIKGLERAKAVYEQWSYTAKSNSIKNFAKDVYVRFPNEEVLYFTQGKWYSNWSTDFILTFSVDNSGKPYLKIVTEPLWQITASEFSISNSMGFYYGSGYFTGESSGIFSTGSTRSTTYKKEGESKGGFLVFSSVEEIDILIAKLKKALVWKKNLANKNNLF